MKVTLKNIGKKYEGNEEWTLRNINLEIQSRDFCVILGPSGCGKTTLLRMLAGLNSVTEGDLLFDGKRMNKIPSKDRDIAMVFQSYALYPHMTVYDNMAFSLTMRKEPKKMIDERVLEAAEVLQVKKHLYSKPSDISGGQRQRVALGRAMVRNPSVFLMDEPLSNLDAKLREHMRVELVRLHKKLGTTSIYVTHDQIEAMTMADMIILMNDGNIQQMGHPEEFYNEPANIFVARFIGSPSINMITGKMQSGKFVSDNGLITITPEGTDAEALKSYDEKAVTVGIRPERFDSKAKSADTFKAKILNIEMLGKEKILYAQLDDGSELTISTPGHYKFTEDTEYDFGFDLEAIHYFDSETELRIRG